MPNRNAPYVADARTGLQSRDELRARIPGWGADLDPNDRPAVPRERFAPDATGAHWDVPERQRELWPRERSVEHSQLTPVFGTSTPPKGVSGIIRQFSYERYSEGRALHWLLLIMADRVDAIESHVRSFATMRPDNPITQTGVLSELRHHPISSRFGHNRADLKHLWMDPLIVAGPWVLAAIVLVKAVRRPRMR